VVYAYLQSWQQSGSMTISFEGCTITGNIAVSVRRHLMMRRCMRALGIVQ